MKTVKVITGAALTIALACVLSGCSFFGNMATEGVAAASAEKMAKAYILGKYGISAQALGHDVKYGGSLVQEAGTTVVVPMSYEDTEFCVYLDMADPSYRYDNYQRNEITAALEGYLLKTCNLPEATYSNLDYNMGSHGPAVGNTTWLVKMGWSENETFTYDSSRMIDFKYEGQSPEELLDKITRVYYKAAFSSRDNVLGSMTVPYDVAMAHSKEIQMSLWNYHDPADLESNVADEGELRSFRCFDLNPEKQEDVIAHGADEVRYYKLNFWGADNRNGQPEIEDLYADYAA